MINSPNVLAALAPPSPAASAAGTTWPRLPRRGIKRPRGLWKARRRLDAPPGPGQQQHQLLQTPATTTATASSSGRGYDTDREEEDERETTMTESGGEGFSEDQEEEDGGEEDDMSQDSSSSKRQRRGSRSGSCGSVELLWAAVYVDPNLGLNNRRRSASADWSADADAVAAVAVADRGAVYDKAWPAQGTGAGVGGSTPQASTPALDVAGGAGGVSPPMIGDDVLGAARDRGCSRRRATPALVSNMVTTSIAESSSSSNSASSSCATKETFEYSDWEEIKETLARASEFCDRDDATSATPLLRAVIHECHRFLVRFPDPSVFFSRPVVGQRLREGSDSPDSVVVMREDSERPWHELGWSSPRRKSSGMSTSPCSSLSSSPEPDFGWSEHRHRHRSESPTALHSALGVALFLLGNIIARDPSLALGPREPTSPSPYWLAALDAFNAGDNLPCQTRGEDFTDAADTTAATSAEDWRAAIAWGRALVALAYEATTKKQQTSTPPSRATTTPRPSPHSPSSSSSTSTARQPPTPPRTPRPRPQTLTPVPTRYHPRSPLAAITALRTVCGAGGSLVYMRSTASELLTLASDQFTRGIFHMPHSPTPTTRAAHAAPPRRRQQVLYTLATEVLVVAERLEDVAARARWAAWADALLLQMHMEADVDAWRVRVGAVRGRCWLVIGGARVDEMEDALERGEVGVLASKEAGEARAGLNTAISFFDRAKGSASTVSSDKSLVDMQPWLAEALITLANLTADEDAREALYARAQAEGGDAVARDLGPRMTRSRAATVVVRMDES